MKKVLMFFLIAAVWAGALRGDGFQPSVLDIELAGEYYYFNEGWSSEIEIDIEVAGTPATAWMVITTRDNADRIQSVQNGRLGWRYVNRIDTTLYVSPSFHLDVGEQSIPWDGKGPDGKYLPSPFVEGQMCGNVNPYNLYIWGYASDSQRVPVCDFIQVSHGMADRHVSIIDHDEDGVPLANPYIFGSDPASLEIDGIDRFDSNTFFKWTLGADPSDASSFVTSRIIPDSMYHSSSMCSTGDIFSPDQNYFVVSVNDTTSRISTMEKWQFIPEGNAVWDQEWGSWDNVEFLCPENADYSPQYCNLTMGSELIWITGSTQDGERVLICYNDDAEEIFNSDIPGGDPSFDPAYKQMQYIVPGNERGYHNQRLLTLSATSCLIQMIDPTMLLEWGAYTEKEDIILWENGNGDFFLDMNFTDNAEYPWGCMSDDPATSHVKTSADIDTHGFSIIWTDYRGLVSFGVLAPDGKAVGYGTYTDEVIPEEGGSRWGGQLLDTGSNFDGMYVVNTEPQNGRLRTSFVGFDCAMGYIEYIAHSDQPIAISESTPQPMILHQNSPNPFNPSTSITFSLPEAGHVSLTVYNVAGQQVAVLRDGDMPAGEHAVAWHADGFSAGVYFYTLTSGGFSRTKKMTLVK